MEENPGGNPFSSIRTYIIAGIAPSYSAKELAEAVCRRVPGACLTFNPDPGPMELLGEIGTLRFDEEKARPEWGWKASYSLPGMVDDFIMEFNENPSPLQIKDRRDP
jgi:nucleoside-diphosphate-sugar epimerase